MFRSFVRAFASLALTAGALTLTAVPAAADVTGGRVTLQSVTRSDGRSGPLTTTGPSVSGIVNVTITDATSDGLAYVHPCGSPAGSGYVLLNYTAGRDETKRVVAASTSCLTTTTPVHFVIDDWGDVSASPSPSGLQFLDTIDSELLNATVAAGSTTVLTLPARPTGAAAAVLFLEAYGSPGYLQVFPCGGPPAPVSDVIVHPVPAADRPLSGNVAYPRFSAAGTVCLYSFAPATVSVQLDGWLATSGPDDTALPPTWPHEEVELIPPGLNPLSPERIVDTRIGLGWEGTSRLPKDAVLFVDLADRISLSTTAVVMNVTVTGPTASGFLTVFPCDEEELPVVSNLNFIKDQTVPNLVNVRVGPSAAVCIYTNAATHVLVDLSATFELDNGAGIQPVTPERILDTRTGKGATSPGKILAGRTHKLQVSGPTATVPAEAVAVTMNVTVDGPTSGGFVTVFPCDQSPMPVVSNLNFVAGQTVPNLVTVKLAEDGSVCLFTTSTAHLIADVSAYYDYNAAPGYEAVNPKRILDTRVPIGVAARGRIATNGVLTLQVTGPNVPTDAEAVTLNVTVTDPGATGFVTVYPCDKPLPTASNLNFVAGQTVPNLVTVSLSATGSVCLYTSATTHLIADLAGYATVEQVLVWTNSYRPTA